MLGTSHGNSNGLAQVAVTLGPRSAPLDRDNFCRTLIGELAETLEDRAVGRESSAEGPGLSPS